MPRSPDQILTVRQMRAAEQALIDAGSSVEALMDVAGRGAADWVWRVAGHRPVTVLCGPGNNGGDGYVIAEALRERGGQVAVIAAAEPRTDAARNARSLFQGEVLGPDIRPQGLRQPQGDRVLVDCLFGSGLARPLTAEHLGLLQDLAQSHKHRIAVDLPSGVDSDSGAALDEGLPSYDLTLALGAWKFAHFLMPACAAMGALRLVPIGVTAVPGAAQLIGQPELRAPAADAHKYRRGLLGVVAGEMPGASVLAAIAAQGAGAGYVKLLGGRGGSAATRSARADLDPVSREYRNPAQAELVEAHALPWDLVLDVNPLSQVLEDKRWSAVLIGPGLGRTDAARARLAAALQADIPTVADADALMILRPPDPAPAIATPHDGEFAALEKAFGLAPSGAKPERALALAKASGAVIVAKGPDTVIAAPDGRLALAPRASSWLSTAGTGDVLAGTIASRLAAGADPFAAAGQGVWLHAEAARHCAAPFTAGDLARAVPRAYAAAS
ncbi:MAG: NAD(P)H-hydrate epimerase [Novosphingobium sp.]